MSLTIQFSTIISMIGGGFYLGCALDTFRRIAIHWKNRLLIAYSLEICFWLLQTLVLFYLLFLVNQGTLRVYIFLSIFLGVAIYKSLFAKLYQRLLELMLQYIRRGFAFLIRLVYGAIIRPIKALLQLLLTILLFFLRVVFSVLQIIMQIVGFPFRLLGKGLKRILPENAKKYLVSLRGFYSKIENIIIKRWKSIWYKRR
ncbi:spore cortex biosynthesis protein YabQ [Paraliobacillus ryukyuensis]|uniref:spore cortex biosynthesis protein YabQ n=1 Tax=Paraliobacillus ryukyuensis TaxID=200904 RepID=UPI0009A6694D|nr:spore cortex biosynthesis protein YabQ [Paraliobacillus ryukyuensis]